MCTRRHKECVKKIVTAVQRVVSRSKLDGDAVFARVGCVRWDDEVVLDVQRNDRVLPDADATDPLLWSRKINDDASRRGERERQTQNAFNRLLPVYWHRKRQVVTNC